MKFFFDQTVASVTNLVLFVVLINLLKGRRCPGPLVSILMYTVIPVDRRVVFGSACGVIWGIYLSLYAVV
ncbi:uncharacterized protein N7446_003525 [Penicillium canescens]|uniref:uncharacterized protein n=1 Tax=Penicillium canescens TaxID=5083 RepID=UPI0026DF0CB9|nr:uncharacterized protein N7446_003525 [Penicillium canescens]KAJ6041158.1 hypothetical protein N7444_010063 [Penicillium canescens]KAJ6066488.1 hypothetical protein N7446_003525 [Penicillium canescens]